MDRLRVCHVITLLELGGAQQNTIYTCSNLDPLAFDVRLVAGAGGYLDDEARRLLGDRLVLLPELVREIRPWRDAWAIGALRRLFGSLRPHIVHTHSSKAGIVGRAAARLAGVPHVIHSIHGFPFHDRQLWPVRRSYLAVERMAARWTERFVAVSERNIETGVRHGLFSRGAVRLIRSGFAISEFATISPVTQGLRREIGIPEGVPVVGTVACLKPQKAPLDFVGVCAVVADAVPACQFVLVGDGVLRRPVEEAVRRAGLRGRFHLLGWRRDVPALLHLFDVFVLASRWEGLPRVVVQARAAGVPVVATGVDGTTEVVRDGVDGFLCEPGDVKSLGACVIKLVGDLNRRAEFASRAREGLQEFDQDRMVRAQEELYRELVAGSAR